MESEILRIIEGGLANDISKIVAYSSKLADRLSREGNAALAKFIRQKIKSIGSPEHFLEEPECMIPIDLESHLSIYKVSPKDFTRQPIVLSNEVEILINDFIQMVNHSSE